MPAPEALYERLRMLAVKEPEEARSLFLAAFESNSRELHEFFAMLARPNEGRLRQLVANALKNHPEKRRVVGDLFRWRGAETDEFARRAIEGALADVDPRSGREGRTQQNVAGPSEVGDVYRYVASRLRHRLRNMMLPAQAQASQLRKLISNDLGMDIQTVIAKLNDAMISMGRELEATDVDPEFFRQRSIALADWLRQMNVRYTAQYTAINFKLNVDAESVRVFANDYLLETVFWNIWLNAQQATGPQCDLIIDFKIQDKHVELRVSDNGGGFTSDLKDVVFQQVYSTRSSSRGRGLLEIQDAVEQLGGHIELYEARS